MPWHDNSGHECYVLVPLPKNNNHLQPIVTNAVRIGKRQPVTLHSLLKLPIQVATGNEKSFGHDTILVSLAHRNFFVIVFISCKAFKPSIENRCVCICLALRLTKSCLLDH